MPPRVNICLPVFDLPPSGRIEIPTSNGTGQGLKSVRQLRRRRDSMRRLSFGNSPKARPFCSSAIACPPKRIRVEALINLNMNFGYGGSHRGSVQMPGESTHGKSIRKKSINAL
jgi:hypothetical protein